MTLRLAQAELSSAVERLWSVVGDLVLITLEDQPEGEAPAAFDDLVNEVSEIQASVAAARTTMRAGDDEALGYRLAETGAQLDVARTRYWRSFRSYEAGVVHHLAARRAARQWPGWWDSVERSASACEGPFEDATAAMHACWREVCQLVVHTQASYQPADRQHRNSPGGCREQE